MGTTAALRLNNLFEPTESESLRREVAALPSDLTLPRMTLWRPSLAEVAVVMCLAWNPTVATSSQYARSDRGPFVPRDRESLC